MIPLSETGRLMLEGMEAKCVEPEKRMCGGVYGWVVHRFPIKGGKSPADTVWRELWESQTKRIGFTRRILNYMEAEKREKSQAG